MILLAVDTSTTSCSVAVLKNRQLVSETTYTAGKTHSRHLMSIVAQTLAACGWGPRDLDGFAVSRGPGTFTGLRIGISTIKGLALSARKPVVGISSLRALAFPLADLVCPVVAMIDARRGEVYANQYHPVRGEFDAVGPASVAAPESLARVIPPDAVLVGSGALQYRDVFADHCPGARVAGALQHIVRASSVGMLALQRFEQSDVDAVENLVPEYIRKSDAQVQASGRC